MLLSVPNRRHCGRETLFRQRLVKDAARAVVSENVAAIVQLDREGGPL